MKKLFLFLAVHFFFMGDMLAQRDVFSVILNKGENLVEKSGTTQAVLLGSAIGTDHLLKVAEGGYIALVHEESGAGLEITGKGDYTFEDIRQRMQDQNSSVLAKYGKFLMEKLNPQDNGNQNLNVTGAVERGDMEAIRVCLPKVVDIYGSRVHISWHRIDDIEDYIITVKDKYDRVIDEKNINGTQYDLDLDEFKHEKIFVLNIRAQKLAELRSPDFGIKRLSTADRTTIEAEFSNISKGAKSENVLDKLLIASFFEENNLLVDAMMYYNEALAICPDPDGFNKLYNNFLVRNELKQ